MRILKYLFITTLCVCISNCSSSEAASSDDDTMGSGDDDGGSPEDIWSIPISDINDGGPGKDGIPSVDNPVFINATDVNFLTDDELIVGIKEGNVFKAYPHYVLDWHEIVNDRIDATNTTINYCPLTGTAFAWKSQAGDAFSTFGVSGLLYNSNLILYDRETDSNWSQILQECVNGELIGGVPEILPVVETTWKTWKNSFPNSLVLTAETGFNKPYGTYPYGPYKTNHDLFLFPPEIFNPQLPNKQRVFAILGDTQSKVYKFSDFVNGKSIRDTYFDTDYLVIGDDNLIVAFEINGSLSNLTFTYNYNDSETFFEDNEGNKWNMFGEAIEGPRVGQKLNNAHSVTSMWFAIAAFFPNPTIYVE